MAGMEITELRNFTGEDLNVLVDDQLATFTSEGRAVIYSFPEEGSQASVRFSTTAGEVTLDVSSNDIVSSTINLPEPTPGVALLVPEDVFLRRGFRTDLLMVSVSTSTAESIEDLKDSKTYLSGVSESLTALHPGVPSMDD